jgi:hypothetical protein
MKSEWEDKTNDEIVIALKQLQMDYDAQKLKTVKEFDKLTEIEKIFIEASSVITERMKGKK